MKFCGVLAVLVGALLCGCSRNEAARPDVNEAARPSFGGDFALTNQDNQPFRLDQLRGRPAVLFFGYTSCPDMCPMTMSRIAAALKLVGDPAREVTTLFVSVDPQRDTPAVLREYVGSFSIPVIGLTGTPDEVARVAAQYHASYEVVPTGTTNYLVNHTSAIFLIDREGRLRQYFRFDEKPETLASVLRTLLSEKS
ncbi:MAG TPA: SCO family protein [Vicinamibacterales bacterium]|jgi:protein SCO1/2|nr:SCO family protein [Vicinamibacterales bacterium]